MGRLPRRVIRCICSTLVSGPCGGLLMVDTHLWRIPDVKGTIPPPLRSHTTTPYRHKIYLFGGGTGRNECYNHVYVFSTQQESWSRIITSDRNDPALPTPRRAHTCVPFDGGLFIFGGGSGTTGLNDLWRFDLVAHKFVRLHPVGKKPEPRVYHTATVVRDAMIVYGGLDGRHCFSNIFLYNFSANTWTELIVFGPKLSRISHTTTSIGSQLFVFGGSNGSVFNNEVWIFDLTSRTWTLRNCEGILPVARGYHCVGYYDSRLWVFGGMDGEWEGFTDVNCLEFGGSGYLGSVYVDYSYVRG
jgi:Rab9 effector protein with kelch motifs